MTASAQLAHTVSMTNTAQHNAATCFTCRHAAALAAYNNADKWAAICLASAVKTTLAFGRNSVLTAQAKRTAFSAEVLAIRAYKNARKAGVGEDTLEAMSR